MKILLTGRNGQLGGALLPLFARTSDVIAPHRGELDLAAPDAVARFLDETAPDLILNAAAYTAVDKAEDEPDLAFAVNARAPGVMAQWAAKNDAVLVQYSTDYVFDGRGDAPLAEDGKTGPLSVYGQSKLAGEQAIARAGGPHLIFRTSWLFSATGNNFVKTMLRLGGERDELRIVDDQVGNPTSAHWLAQATFDVIDGAGADLAARLATSGGIFHAACAGHASWYDFAAEIFSQARDLGVPLKVDRVAPIPSSAYPTKATRPANSRLALDRIKNVWGIRPPRWQDALGDVLRRLYPS